jgi:putative heme transporter
VSTDTAIAPILGELPAAGRPGGRRRVLRWSAAVVLLAAPLSLLGFLPRSVGARWGAVLSMTRSVSVGWMVVLAVVWLAGLLAHSLVLTSSLPGLTSRRAVSLNLAGSAVANSVPLGGAISVGVTSAMVRSWGFAPVALGAYLTVSTAWNLLVRLLVGAVGLSWLAATQSGDIWGAGSVMLGVAGVVVALLGLALARERSTARLSGLMAAGVNLMLRSRGPRADERRRRAALTGVRVRRQTFRLIARSWARLSIGMIGYLALLSLLLDLCLRAIGSPEGFMLVIAAVGVERLVSAVPITPGGAGVAELGLVACLTVSGVPPVTAVTATFLYRLFTFFMEIPVGLMVTVAWGVTRRRAHRAAVAVRVPTGAGVDFSAMT